MATIKVRQNTATFSLEEAVVPSIALCRGFFPERQ
jgi:hypothetical protein